MVLMSIYIMGGVSFVANGPIVVALGLSFSPEAGATFCSIR